jgi:hypothetical protein
MKDVTTYVDAHKKDLFIAMLVGREIIAATAVLNWNPARSTPTFLIVWCSFRLTCRCSAWLPSALRLLPPGIRQSPRCPR